MKQPQQECEGQINRFTGENAIRIVTKMELTGSKDELDQLLSTLTPVLKPSFDGHTYRTYSEAA